MPVDSVKEGIPRVPITYEHDFKKVGDTIFIVRTSKVRNIETDQLVLIDEEMQQAPTGKAELIRQLHNQKENIQANADQEIAKIEQLIVRLESF